MRKLGERLMNSDFDFVFQAFMRPKFFQSVGEIIFFACWNVVHSSWNTVFWDLYLNSSAFCCSSSLFFLPYCCILRNNIPLRPNDELFYWQSSSYWHVWSSGIGTILFSFFLLLSSWHSSRYSCTSMINWNGVGLIIKGENTRIMSVH